jgi:hypothetical protein
VSSDRVRWEVRPAGGGERGWKVTRRSERKGGRFIFKFLAVRHAVGQCKAELRHWNIRSELMICNRNGRYDDPRTYGDDPPESKG